MGDFLKRAARETNTDFAVPAAIMRLSPAHVITEGMGSAQISTALAAVAHSAAATIDGFACVGVASASGPVLPAEEKTWRNEVGFLTFMQSFSPDELEQMRNTAGFLQFSLLSPDQQEQFWNLQHAVDFAGPLGRMQEPFDATKTYINVDRSADVRLVKSDGTKTKWLTLFDYTVSGLVAAPAVHATRIGTDIGGEASPPRQEVVQQVEGANIERPAFDRQVALGAPSIRTAGALIALVSQTSGICITIDARLKGQGIYLTANRASGRSILHAIASVLHVEPRQVGNEVFLARSLKPLNTLTGAERLGMALSMNPQLDQQYRNLRDQVRSRLTSLPFSDAIPFPEAWFTSSKLVRFQDLPTDGKEWLLAAIKANPEVDDDTLSAKMETCDILFGNNLWIVGYYGTTFTFFFQVD